MAGPLFGVPMIQVRNLSVAYGAQQALRDISLSVDDGEFVWGSRK